jgi:hypothetical protein
VNLLPASALFARDSLAWNDTDSLEPEIDPVGDETNLQDAIGLDLEIERKDQLAASDRGPSGRL